jgi:hypothetical protein
MIPTSVNGCQARQPVGWVSTRTIRRVLVQVAASLPRFLFALPAGVLADSVDLRKLLILIQASS